VKILKHITGLQQHWLHQGTALLFTLSVIVLTWLPAYQLLITTWNSNGTYTHSYMIVPISLYLAWELRARWLSAAPQPWWPMLVPIAAISLLYTLGMLSDLVGVQHAAAVIIVLAVCAFFLGKSASRILWFPLLYLLFAIPFGEFLLPTLMHFTADFTVLALQLVGIPVYREGLFFTLPSGNWSVIEACSGLRYLIASLALGVLFAWLNYRSWKRRLIFVALSAIVPVFANGARAFLIVTLGHVSNMRLAVGVDHFIYGWVFFALVMFAMFWIGMRWREDTPANVPPVSEPLATQPAASPRAIVLSTAAGLVAALALPLAAMQLKATLIDRAGSVDLRAAAAKFDQADGHFSDYKPYYLWPRAQLDRQVRYQGKPLGLFVAYYSGQENEHKLISIINKIVSTRQRGFNLIRQTTVAPENPHSPARIVESEIHTQQQQLLAWHWFHVCGQTTTSETRAKLLQMQCTLTHLDDSGSIIVLYAPLELDRQAAQQQLAKAAAELWPEVQGALTQPTRHGPHRP